MKLKEFEEFYWAPLTPLLALLLNPPVRASGGEDSSPIKRAKERCGYVAQAWPTVGLALAFEPLGQLQMYKTGMTWGSVSISGGVRRLPDSRFSWSDRDEFWAV